MSDPMRLDEEEPQADQAEAMSAETLRRAQEELDRAHGAFVGRIRTRDAQRAARGENL